MNRTDTTGPIRPPRLCTGSKVALVAPGGSVTPARIDAAIRHCRELGLEPVIGREAREHLGYLAGPDAARAADLQRAINDPQIAAIWALRGGYGAMRILRRIDLSPLRDRPKAFIGFSDNTVLHLALARAGLVSFHGPHPGNAFPEFSRNCFRDTLFSGATGALPLPAGDAVTTLRGGIATGRLAGGNLSLLAAACGTAHALQANGCIVIIEDIGEPAYRVDRAIMQLLLAGALDGAAGFAIGRFTERAPAETDRPLTGVFTELLAPLGAPIAAGFPFGHLDAQWFLPLGVNARLDADHGTLEVLEPGVT